MKKIKKQLAEMWMGSIFKYRTGQRVYSSVVEGLPSMHVALVLVPCITKEQDSNNNSDVTKK
jgi:hypothetical protein